MRRRLLLVLLAWAAVAGAASAQSARSAPTSAREWADAQCVAALDAQTEALAQQVKAGQADLKGLLRARLKAGAAFIGRAWLDGERDEEGQVRIGALVEQVGRQVRRDECELESAGEEAEAEGVGSAPVADLR